PWRSSDALLLLTLERTTCMDDYWKTKFCGPLAPYGDGLRGELSALAYAPSTVTSHLALWAQLSCWLERHRLEPSALTAAVIEEFLAERRRTHGYLCTVKALSPGLGFLRRVGAVPGVQAVAQDGSAVAVIERQFRSYLLVERGLAGISAETYVARARPFLVHRARRGGLDLESLTAADVGDFVAVWLPGLSSAPARSTVTALRSLLSFLHATGVVATPLAPVVPAVASWRLAGLPIGLTPVQVQALLGACDRSTAVGRRDFAIVTLLARLGLRAGEVAALTLDDIGWRAGTLTVHGKANTHEQLPLPVDVGSALAGYLEHGRPSHAARRALFLRAKAPYRALAAKSISTMVNRAAGRAGLRTVHAHLLRHTLATQVLAAGASLDEVGQLLRHRSRASTAIYAKVDQQRLSRLARPWPTAGGPR
ncbi:MAG: site-specific integrase, partial [Lapillicoccus sp.]